ncbi:MAG: amidohydrolase family protein, partial [Bacteroidaceae bacterium]|nr:amidohydrolase family protein [Bacteroidaceae bacterium]
MACSTMQRTIIRHATLVNEGRTFVGTVVVEGEHIVQVVEEKGLSSPDANAKREDFLSALLQEMPGEAAVIDATGMYLLPGVIDEHVHFREPGLTHKATIASESRKAVMGGVTSFMDMPNCIPQTTNIELVEAKHRIAEACSPANWSFYLGATADNLTEIERLDPAANCGVKVFMGSSTGGMLLGDDESLYAVFRSTPLPIALHCEDQDIITANIARYKAEFASANSQTAGQIADSKSSSSQYPDDLPLRYHPLIRSEEACFRSSARAVEIAEKTGANIHILHISTARELSLFQQGPVEGKRITSEACIPHLLYTDADYPSLGTAIKCNPAIKSAADRAALRDAIRGGLIDTVGTDHAPHTAADKEGGALRAASGIATLPHSLTAML